MSRRYKRFKNRQLKRENKKEKLKTLDNFEKVASLESLYNSTKKASLGVSWKASVQRYLLSILFKISRTRRELLAGKDIRKGFIEFDLCERGKTRHISSVHFSERVVQKSLVKHVLYPVLTNGIIYDNYASQKYKGVHFAQDRLVKYLREFYRQHKRDGYILLVDFKGYFESILHEPLKENFRRLFTDEKIIKLSSDFVDAFGQRGLGLGSETSQINAIIHVSKIDHYIKEVLRIRAYGRYMDDSYIIIDDKEKLKEILSILKEKYNAIGVTINDKKTHIISLRHGFTFLKTRFSITETGKIIKKPCRDSITRERRKLKKQAKLYEAGVLTLDEILQSYNSWRGSIVHRNARKTIFNMDKLYKKLFERSKENDRKLEND